MDIHVGDRLIMKKATHAAAGNGLYCVWEWIFVCDAVAAGMKSCLHAVKLRKNIKSVIRKEEIPC